MSNQTDTLSLASDGEEEEILVYAQFEDDVNIENFRDVHVLGITENKPIIQMDDTFFAGKFVNSMGTYMFFEDDLHPKSIDPLFDKLPERSLKYVHKTTKLLDMEHAYVTPKGQRDQQQKSAVEKDDEDIEPLQFKTAEEALQKLKDEFFKNHQSENISTD